MKRIRTRIRHLRKLIEEVTLLMRALWHALRYATLCAVLIVGVLHLGVLPAVLTLL